jgi:hypothetical protein
MYLCRLFNALTLYLMFRRMKGRKEGLHLLTPRGQLHPWGSNFTPRDQISPLEAKFKKLA